MDKFKTIALFMSTIETGSFSATAKKHATDPSTVSKAIKRLEEQLGLQLLYRSTRQLSLTSAGQKYADTVGSLYQQLESCEYELKSANNSYSGALKINLPVSYGRVYMLPMLSRFKKAYPDIELEVSFNDQYVDMISDAVDVSIRSGTLNDSRLVAQKLSPMAFVICASSDLVATRKVDISNEGLVALPWVLFRFKQTGKTMPINFSYKGCQINIEPKKVTIVDDGETMAQMCAEGLGLSLMPHFNAKALVVAGKMKVVAILDEFPSSGVFIVYPKRKDLPRRTQVFIEFVKDYLKEIGETPSKTWLDTSINSS
ncbi:LysR family transcriptional regulator [Colwellia sp. Bg11-28]|uniref:LysR family transcriptional regulator n=1 Tax=Colwellia sp. Bg11-28 TaxID=2058305 RepID=UPI000C33ADDD|nr:LysR family transcriptional regulator [Colwellia sp. Bg11-28]PKH89460.1 LysR family transcriptional regulator [Colwellia sp. Bg11-28]